KRSGGSNLSTSTPALFLMLTTFGLMAGAAPAALAQGPVKQYTLQEAEARALKQNPAVGEARVEVKRSQASQGASWNLEKTQVQFSTGKLATGTYDNEVSVSQSFSLPMLYSRQAKLATELTEVSKVNLTQHEREVIRDVRLNYYGLVYAQSRLR